VVAGGGDFWASMSRRRPPPASPLTTTDDRYLKSQIQRPQSAETSLPACRCHIST
jgi:hypothetical protein